MGRIVPGQHLSPSTEFKKGDKIRLGKPGGYHGGAKPEHFVSGETRKKLSLAHKGKTNLGKRNSPQTEIKKGQHLSPSTEFKVGDQAQLGRHNPHPKLKELFALKRISVKCNYCGKITPVSKSRSMGRYFCSRRCSARAHSGQYNNKWKGGITPENSKIRHSEEYKQWRSSVFIRDKFTCQLCLGVGGKLHAHHIDDFSGHPELRFSVDNGITLCRQCHIDVHSHKFG